MYFVLMYCIRSTKINNAHLRIKSDTPYNFLLLKIYKGKRCFFCLDKTANICVRLQFLNDFTHQGHFVALFVLPVSSLLNLVN